MADDLAFRPGVRERSLRVPRLMAALESDDQRSFVAEMRSLVDPDYVQDLSDADVLQLVDRLDTAVRAWELSTIAGDLMATRAAQRDERRSGGAAATDQG